RPRHSGAPAYLTAATAAAFTVSGAHVPGVFDDSDQIGRLQVALRSVTAEARATFPSTSPRAQTAGSGHDSLAPARAVREQLAAEQAQRAGRGRAARAEAKALARESV